jgi:predicted ATPase/class 3 adenylate cyclase/Tfp pilus assembly protein PilF
MDKPPAFGPLLKTYRKACDLTQEQLAEKVSYSVETIKKIEAGKLRPSKQLAVLLAHQLGIPPEERAAFFKSARAELAADRLAVPAQPLEPTIDTAAARPALGIERLTLPSGTVTFLFTDIEGSTRLWEQHPDVMAAALARHDAILVAAVVNHGGTVFKTVGDGIHAAFARVADALAAALAAQRALAALTWGVTGPLWVRMALHTGSAEQRDGDYFGPPLNRLARLLRAGHGGQILLSRATQELVHEYLPHNVELRDLGVHQLKDLSSPEQIFQLVTPDLPADFPALKSLGTAHNLPAQLTSFIGRERELAEIRRLLANSRLLTLTGAGGSGKTRLALQVAADGLENFAHGAFVVNLAPIRDANLVIPTIAQTLGVREAGGRPLLELLADYLHVKRMLVLLDNFEQVIVAATQVASLLTACPQLTVLVTSRAALHLRGEQEYPVLPLALPTLPQQPSTGRPSSDPNNFTQYEAVRLFVERAQAVKPDFTLSDKTAPIVAEICRHLDGLPLAIELAAARIKLLTPQAMLARLVGVPGRMPLLTGGPGDLPLRQQTLRHTIGWSYDLLEEGEKQLFRRLAVFVGGRTLEAIEAVCNVKGDLAIGLLDGVASLIDKNLLRQSEGAGGEPRYSMLETLHEFASEKLAESGEQEMLREQHARYFLKLAGQVEPALRGPEQLAWLNRLEEEHDNFRAALQWANEQPAAEVGLRLAGPLSVFWHLRGYWQEGQAQIARILAHGGAKPTAARARCLIAASTWASYRDTYAAATMFAKEALAIYRTLEDEAGMAGALQELGNLADYQANYSAARAYHEESLALRRGLGDKPAIAGSLSNLGLVAGYQGDYPAARAKYEEALAIWRELGDNAGLSRTLNNLGLAVGLQGDYATARVYFEESLALSREIGQKLSIANTLGNLGWIVYRLGDYSASIAYYQEALALFQELGHSNGIATVLADLAEITSAHGQSARAARLFGAAKMAREVLKVTVKLWSQDNYERMETAARERLGDEVFTAAWAEGQAMSLEQAIAEALGQ